MKNENGRSTNPREELISELRPHFLFNSLACISALCRRNPDLAREGIGEFAAHLRYELDSLGRERIVEFSEELKEIEHYLWLEKLNYSDRLRVEYDIQTDRFELPALSILRNVETAIKRGIANSPSGGTVRISSCEKNGEIIISVEEDVTGTKAIAVMPEVRK